MDVLAYTWVLWLALILVFVVIEMMTVDFTFLMLAVGSLGGLILALLGTPFALQIVVACLVAALLLLAVRPPLLRRLRRGEDHTPSNMDAVRTMRGIAVKSVTARTGLVRLSNGETWTARSDSEMTIDPGEQVQVRRVDGATVVVVPVETSHTAAPSDERPGASFA